LLQRKIRIVPFDFVVILAVLGFGAFVGYRIHTELNYKWDWGAIPQYLVRYDAEQGRWVPNLLLEGLFTTIRLSLWATLLATVLGTAMGICRISGRLFRRMVGRSYVELIRNLPPLVLVFIFYYFVSSQVMPILGVDEFVRSRSETTQAVLGFLFAPPARFTEFISAVITLAVFEGAYIAEIVRAGIQAVEKGQWEASHALGLSRWQQMRHVVLPQALPQILPPLAGQFISTIKDSAIVSIISIQELTFQGMELMSATYLTFEVWITVTALYLVLTLTCSLAVERLEARMRRSTS
jgi:polar amino acid transport system permease protein